MDLAAVRPAVGADTVQRPGGDAAVVRVHGSKKALAITTDCTPRYCYADPYEGGKQAVAEAYRNLCAVGAKPLAITNCLNFGNPQRPEIMGQFVGCVEGMAEACRALDFPVVSGNVITLQRNQERGRHSLAILPTPAIGGVGLLTSGRRARRLPSRQMVSSSCFLGASQFVKWPGTSISRCGFVKSLGKSPGRRLRSIFKRERQTGEFVRQLIESGAVTSVHDVSDGGVLVAIAEMALAGGRGA